MITLHTTGCPKCKILEKVLKEENIKVDVVNTDVNIMEKEGISTVPVLEIEGEKYDFMHAVKWARESGN